MCALTLAHTRVAMRAWDSASAFSKKMGSRFWLGLIKRRWAAEIRDQTRQKRFVVGDVLHAERSGQGIRQGHCQVKRPQRHYQLSLHHQNRIHCYCWSKSIRDLQFTQRHCLLAHLSLPLQRGSTFRRIWLLQRRCLQVWFRLAVNFTRHIFK